MRDDPHRLVVAIEEAVQHLAKKLRLLGALDPEAAARDFIDWQRHNGWRPLAPVTALPPKPPFGTPPTPTFLAARAQLPRRTPQTATTEESE